MTAEAFDEHVRVIEAIFADLPDLVEEWSTLGVADRATAEYEWSEAMARLNRLADAAAKGQLESRRRRIVAELRRRLASNLAMVETIGLRDPRASALASTAAVSM